MIPITIVYAILIFVVLILVHEAGHFLAAKACGVQVNEFAFGLGPAIFKKKIGETVYAVRALPFGGQCVMEGEDESSDNPRAFPNAARWKRFIILFAGVFMNFLLGLIVLICLIAPQQEYVTTKIDYVMDKFTGGDAIRPGDRIVSIDGRKILLSSDIASAMNAGDDYNYDFVIERDGEYIRIDDLHVEPQPYEENGETVYYYGFHYRVEKLGFFEVLRQSWFSAVNMVRMVFDTFAMLFRGQVGFNDLSGPIGIVAVMSDVAQQSMYSFWYLSAFIAINLAVMNLLPIPALDGGRIFFLLIEAVTRRKINEKFEGILNAAMLILLLGLMVAVAVKDIVSLVG